MQAKIGAKLEEPVSGVTAIVVKASGDSSIVLSAGDVPIALGKRYTCATCASEVLITKAGAAELGCHGESMGIAEPRTLPSSD